MKIKNLQITSASTLKLQINIEKPVCVLRGEYSNLALDLIRELIGDYGAENDPDRFDDGHFVIHSDIEMDGKNYTACYIRNADFMGDNRLAVNFVPNSLHYSEDDTYEFVNKCNKRDTDSSNVFDRTNYNSSIENLSESDRILVSFHKFIGDLTKATANGDDRPIFIYDLSERLDIATDIAPILSELSSLPRQVFISVCNGESALNTEYEHTQTFKLEDV